MSGEVLGRVHTPWHLWVTGVVTLMFNALGITSYVMTKLDLLDHTAMTPAQIAFMQTYPAWATAVWAMGVWGAFAGSVLLLLRSRWAVAAMVVAMIGLIGVTIAEVAVLDVPAQMRTPMGLRAAIWGSTLFLLAYSRAMARARVLG